MAGHDSYAGKHVPQLPVIGLQQPSKVLGPEVVAARHARLKQGDVKLRAVQEHCGTLSDRELEMLRHSYTLMAGEIQPACACTNHG